MKRLAAIMVMIGFILSLNEGEKLFPIINFVGVALVIVAIIILKIKEV
jgi:hypothetical protein